MDIRQKQRVTGSREFRNPPSISSLPVQNGGLRFPLPVTAVLTMLTVSRILDTFFPCPLRPQLQSKTLSNLFLNYYCSTVVARDWEGVER